MAGVDLLHVPFKGGGPAMIDVMGGHTKVLFGSLVQMTAAHPLRQAQGAGHRRREAQPRRCPIVPTVAEAGVPGYEGVELVGRPGAGRHAEGDRRQAQPGHRRGPRLAGDAEAIREPKAPRWSRWTRTEFGKFLAAEMAKWERVVKEAKIKAE